MYYSTTAFLGSLTAEKINFVIITYCLHNSLPPSKIQYTSITTFPPRLVRLGTPVLYNRTTVSSETPLYYCNTVNGIPFKDCLAKFRQNFKLINDINNENYHTTTLSERGTRFINKIIMIIVGWTVFKKKSVRT